MINRGDQNVRGGAVPVLPTRGAADEGLFEQQDVDGAPMRRGSQSHGRRNTAAYPGILAHRRKMCDGSCAGIEVLSTPCLPSSPYSSRLGAGRGASGRQTGVLQSLSRDPTSPGKQARTGPGFRLL